MNLKDGSALRRLAAAAFAAAALGACATPAAAQTVTGRLVEQESARPLSAAVVTLIDTAGRQRAAILTDTAGAFVLRAPAPGRWRVRAEHIGRETVTSDELRLGAGAGVSVRLEAPIAAILLKPLAVEVQSRCVLHPASAETTQRLWEEARKAFRLSSLARTAQPFVLRLFERVLDPNTYRVLNETKEEKAGVGGRPFGAAPEAELDSLGYVRNVTGLDELAEQWEFWAPDEEVLLADGFLEHHCLRLANGGRAHRGMVGIGFEPVRPLGRDIRGTVWLDARTAQLRNVEFRFTNLPWDVPEQAQGGRVEFQQMPSGVVVARSWWMRMPIVRQESEVRGGGTLSHSWLWRIRESGGELEAAPAVPR